MKKALASIMVSILMLALFACNNETTSTSGQESVEMAISENAENTDEINSTENSTFENSTEENSSGNISNDETSYDEYNNPGIGGGDDVIDFVYWYGSDLFNLLPISTENGLIVLIPEDDVDKFVTEHWIVKTPEERRQAPVLYLAIQHFNISKDKFTEFQNVAQKEDLGYCSQEVIDALYSDKETMIKTCICPLALYFKGEIYTFKELDEKKIIELMADGLTKEELTEHYNSVLSFFEEYPGITSFLNVKKDRIDTLKKYAFPSDPVDTSFLYGNELFYIYPSNSGDLSNPRFTEEYDEFMKMYQKLPESEKTATPILYQAIQYSKISKDDFIVLQDVRKYYHLSYCEQSLIDALYSDKTTMLKACKMPTSLYFKDKVYKLNELDESRINELISSGLTKQELKEYHDAINNYYTSNPNASSDENYIIVMKNVTIIEDKIK